MRALLGTAAQFCEVVVVKSLDASRPKPSRGARRSHSRERLIYSQPTGPDPLNHYDDLSRPALRHGSLNSLFPGSLISTFPKSDVNYIEVPAKVGFLCRVNAQHLPCNFCGNPHRCRSHQVAGGLVGVQSPEFGI